LNNQADVSEVEKKQSSLHTFSEERFQLPSILVVVGMMVSSLSFSKFWSFDSVTSTMDVARELASRVEACAVGLVTAKTQTAGRGRQGRVWMSAEGAFLGTYIIRLSALQRAGNQISIHYSKLSGYSLVVGLSLHRFLEQYGIVAALKWPNDILTTDGRKIAGVLIEVIPETDGLVVLCGIGLNLMHRPQAVLGSAGIVELGNLISRHEFINEFTHQFLLITEQFLREGFAPFRNDWISRAFKYDGDITVKSGDLELRGCWNSVNEQGELQIRKSDGSIRTISSGEIG
jgi:BirA family biotin operon repressor/biotin-[acetyl-CoA-carboxylase] ligase